MILNKPAIQKALENSIIMTFRDSLTLSVINHNYSMYFIGVKHEFVVALVFIKLNHSRPFSPFKGDSTL